MSNRSSKRRTASLAALALTGMIGSLAMTASPGDAAEAPTSRNYNGPESCVTIDASGNVTAPGPGDCAQYGKAGQGRTTDTARNVILIIGDGMGQQEITAARNYLKGAAGRFEGIDELTSEGHYTHHSIDRNGKFNYVTDSAASGTAWSTGTKTYNGALGIKIDGTPVENMIEIAKKAGMRTGNVTTSEIQDATPAAMGSHALGRKCYGPENTKAANKSCFGAMYDKQYRENGGLGSISEQLIETRADVTLGGGAKAFNQQVKEGGAGRNPFLTGVDGMKQTNWTAGKTVLENAKDNGFQVVTTADELSAVKKADQDNPVLGLFHPGNMTTRFAPYQAEVGGGKKAPHKCEKQDIGTEPELPLMANKAIELLDDPKAEKGFFLQIESASIDKRAHGSDICGQIGETERLDEVTKAALDFAKKDGNTLVVVTADHSHTTQIVYDEVDNVSATARVLTADGQPMTVSYGTIPTDEIKNGSTQHTGAQLRIAAFGPGEENVIGQTDQTDLFYTLLSALDLNPDKAKSATDAALKKPVAASKPNDTCFKVDANGNVVAPDAGECGQYGTEGQQRSNEQAKNVILFIGDGMGDSEITSARNYLYGANGRLPGVDAMDYTGSYTHWALDPKNGKPSYVTDSAASGTGWATGTKTYNGAISVGLDGKPQANLLEMAKAKGLKTGNVSTAEIQDATPAVMGSHALNRKCYGPERDKNSKSCQTGATDPQFRENGGLGSISEQLVDTRADVTLGGGSKAFGQTVQVSGTAGTTKWAAGKTVVDNAKANGYKVVTNKAELDAVTAADQSTPVLGLFAEGNMPRHFLRSVPTTDGANKDAEECKLNPERTKDIPTMADMTGKALDLLKNDKGFFLQVEGASIDKADHDSDICGQIGELDDLDQAVQVARKWVAENKEPTLIVVTADHAHTSQIVQNSVLTSGLVTKLRTADGDEMSVNYASAPTNEAAVKDSASTHTGAQLRIAAQGPSAENVLGFTDQTDLHYTIVNALSLDTNVPAGIPFKPAGDTAPTPDDKGDGNGDDQGDEQVIQPDQDGSKPKPGMPKTGTDASTGAVFMLALMAGAVLIGRRNK
ncbi:MAG: alkaline phosphatase [Propionibacteriaceae bacterium]|nr:alkaline phosphatase [Propionibacteriaceae bacterium]